MAFIKRIVTIVALIYLLLALIMLFFPHATSSVFGLYTLPLEVNMLLGLAWGSVIVVGLLLIFENIDSGLLRRNVSKKDQKINELKAQLFDAKKPLASPNAYNAPLANPNAYNTPPATGQAAPYNAPPTTPPNY